MHLCIFTYIHAQITIYIKKTALFSRIIVVMLFAIITLNVEAQKKIELKFQPENNSKYIMTSELKNSSSQMGMEVSMDLTTVLSALVTTHSPNTLMTFQYTNLKASADMMGQKVNVDSDQPGSNNESLKKMTNKPFDFLLDKNGTVIKVTGFDSLLASFGPNNPAANFLNEDAIKSLMDQNFSFYPNKSVGVGDSWTKTSTIFNSVKLNTNTTYTLEKVENNLAYIKLSATAVTEGTQKMSINGMEVALRLKGTQTGEIVVDMQTGLFTTSTTQQNLQGAISAMGQEIPVNIKSDLSSTFKKP
ncbi:MAG: hypothetical protein DI598_03260 [Pseudopedobacter saltans]|uniref:Uncharacterized protein n=1 Tax=Pseudopedobacter saltans TaxID=151895 RepID=A0A2W5FCQ6_9SPHI|nr:MAG: hypothetical protein DI598_03260 [Pseudopedobacter saltans]